MTSTNPLLSIVCCSRNDDHGVDLLKRCSLFVRGLLYHCKKHQYRAELIMVEWNPPEGKPLLKELLPLPTEEDWLSIRFVVVPKAIHDAIPCLASLPLHQMIAKNVGIRRARAPFVLCTNNDLLFTDELFGFLAKTPLQEGVFYRANRCDVPATIDYRLGITELLNYCSKNILLRNGKHYRYPELIGAKSKINRFSPAAWLLCHLSKLRQNIFPKPTDLLISLDAEACGDFTLMSKKDWLDIGGYFEVGAYPSHIDTLALIAAKLKGKRQCILPLNHCTYHISHESGWDLEADPIKNLHKDIARPRINWRTVQHLTADFVKNKKVLPLNSANWGYPEKDFLEYRFP